MRLSPCTLLLLSLMLPLLACTAYAQDAATGALSGVVYDPSGAVIANAKVVVTSPLTGAIHLVVTNSQGAYRASFLAPGEYSVAASAVGFSTRTWSGVLVSVSEVQHVDLTLDVQGPGTNVEAVANLTGVQTDSSALGRVIGSSAITALPLASRNYTQVLALSPGVIVPLPNAAQLGSGTQNVADNGAKTTANNFQFNGVDANNLAQNSAANDAEEVGTATPAPDSIQEFKVQTANYDAGFGRGSGANIDLVSRAGTNQFHGAAWEFVRNNIFNANDFFVKGSGQARPTLKQNQFGGSFGGPILRDRTLFFGSYEGLREVNGLGNKRSALLPLLTSDRSAAVLGAQFCPASHLVSGVPASGYLTHAGGTQVACDGSNINPVALAVLNAKLPNGDFVVPSPQVPLTVTDSQLPIGRSTFAPPAHYRGDQFSISIDQHRASTDTLSGRFFYSRSTASTPFSPNAADVPGWGSDTRSRNTVFVLSESHTFRPNVVNVARLGYVRYDGLLTVQGPLLASAIGQGTPTGLVGPTTSAPGITIDGLFTIGDAGTPSQWQVTNTFLGQDTVSVTHGRHNLRFGAEYKRHQLGLDAPFTQDGLLDIATFADFLVGQSAAQNGSPTGTSNVTSTQGASGLSRKDTRYRDFAAFVQDDIKLTSRLTLNAGLRYEVFGAPYETHGLLPNFDPALAVDPAPVGGTFTGYVIPSNFSGALPQGYTQLARGSLWPTRYGDVSPRLGFAWVPTHSAEIVLRGGYGLYYDRHSGDYTESLQGQPPFSIFQFSSGSVNAGATLQKPFSPLLPAPSTYPIFTPREFGGFPFLEGLSPDTVDARTQEYNVNIQYAFAPSYLLEIGYVGTSSAHRPGSIEFNQALLASPSHPVRGETMNSANNLIERLPYDGVSPGSLFTTSDFSANYNSLQSSLTKQLRHGLQFLASYTWSKSLDETSGSNGDSAFELWLLTNDQHNPRQAYGPSDFDRTHRGVLSFVYSTPRLQQLSFLPRYLLGNWEFSGIGVIQSGSPITVMDGNAGSVYGNFENRAQRTGASPATSGSMFSRITGHFLDGGAFTRAPEVINGTGPADQEFGNSGVGIVHGPGQHNLDLALERRFPLGEVRSLSFRTEFFNVTNTPEFANPNSSIGYADPTSPTPSPSASFGTINSSAANPRIIQFALKLSF